MKDMFGCQIFHNVEYLRRKKKNKVTMATYIHIRGYKTRQTKNTENGEMLVYTCRTLQKLLRKIGCPNWDHT